MLADMQYALRHAAQHHCVVVVVVPLSRQEEALTHLIALAGDKIPFGGRMMLAGGGGRLKVHVVSEPTPPLTFDVMFAGWGHLKAEGAEEMDRWRTAANQIVTRVA